eukprot:4725_1
MIYLVVLFLAYSGLIISPVLVVKYVLLIVDKYNDEIQSWMIAYITWGVTAYITATLYNGAVFSGDWSEGNNLFNMLANIILLVIGIDFGDFDMFSDGGMSFWCMIICGSDEQRFTGIAVLILFPAIASLLPAAICGYVANFVLEEKFELKCGTGITTDYLCFDDGCCKLVSSHDIQNMPKEGRIKKVNLNH